MNTQQPLLINEEKYITPLTEILETNTQILPKLGDSPQTLKKSLDDLFPEQQYDEKKVKKAKEILGDLSSEFTELQLRSIVMETEALAETWLDNFERELFSGLTLKELLHEKGGST